MESCPGKAAAACTGGGAGGELKRNLEQQDLCVRKLSVGYWRVSRYLFGKLPPTKTCPASFPWRDCLLCWHLLGAVGEGERATKELFMSEFPHLGQSASAPHISCCVSRGLRSSCGSLECDWLESPPSVWPKMPGMLGTGVGAGCLIRNLPQGVTTVCLGARDPEPGHRASSFHYYYHYYYYYYCNYCYFPALFFKTH